MQPNTEQTDNIKSAKYISWIILLSIFSIGISGQINYWMPEYSNMDQVFYRNMAISSPELNFEVVQPFVYRILAPWVAGVIPINLELSFYFLNLFIARTRSTHVQISDEIWARKQSVLCSNGMLRF